jgi:hypothetical protein
MGVTVTNYSVSRAVRVLLKHTRKAIEELEAGKQPRRVYQNSELSPKRGFVTSYRDPFDRRNPRLAIQVVTYVSPEVLQSIWNKLELDGHTLFHEGVVAGEVLGFPPKWALDFYVNL